jgi:hypothetical protein
MVPLSSPNYNTEFLEHKFTTSTLKGFKYNTQPISTHSQERGRWRERSTREGVQENMETRRK